MSPRAAWRLEALGFGDVYDYAAGKSDWFACGLPREGASAEVPWVGDLIRDDVATCTADARIGEARDQVAAMGLEFCVVLGEQRIVAGLLRGDALAKSPDTPAEEVMELGPRTIRPSVPVETLLGKRSSQGVKSWLVTTSHGVLLGLLVRDEAERALDESKASAPGAER
jgi:predicted transcriptional regulator